MANFTVFFHPGSDKQFGDGDSYKIDPTNAVLTIKTVAGERYIYSPSAWRSIADRTPEKRDNPRSGMVVRT